jgi:16S rRNA (cytosine1402-N4)-methyltransferase
MELGEHKGILIEEAIQAMVYDTSGSYVDMTFGRGGHAQRILNSLDNSAQLLVLDRDPEAIHIAKQLAEKDVRVTWAHERFGNLGNLVIENGSLNGVLFDLGVSSPQVDDPQRGFSFLRDGPLDMRMDPSKGFTAADWICSASEDEIADVIFRYGEERHSRRMAKRVVAARRLKPISTTVELAELFKAAHPAWKRDRHPATKAFQAIRIYVNEELDELSQGLDIALDRLCVGGRIVVISFHSLEDRIVKRFMSRHVKGDDFPRGLPVTDSELCPRLKLLGKPQRVSAVELADNARSRSAIMRVAQKIK